MKIWTTCQFEGFHKWENAPDEVAFLRNLHRHLFHVKITIEVLHNDRELEFFIVQRKLKKCIEMLDKHSLGSCEMIAEELKDNFIKYGLRYEKRRFEIEVSEDGESGAIV